MGKRTGWALVAALALLAFVGCSAADTVKEPDRVVVEYNRQMWSQAAVLASTIGSSAPDAAIALAQLAADGTAAANHMLTIWGAPKIAPPPYSHSNLGTAIDQSGKAHASVWLHPWALVGYGAMALLMGLKIAGSFFPGVGTFLSSAAGSALESVAGAIVNIKKTADTNPQDTIHVSDIQGVIAGLRENPTVDALLQKAHVDNLVDSSIHSPAAAPAGSLVVPSASPTAA
jgi:hypothetical protein